MANCDHCGDERTNEGNDNIVKNKGGGYAAVSIIHEVPYIIPAVLGGSDRQDIADLCDVCRQILKDWLLLFFGKAKKNEQP